tara:strand:- start:1775 stop:2584 length:810 start_codon:yes stop_codon:yes gene_type:complete
VVIINPGYFREEAVEFINTLGPVKHIITSTASHGEGIVNASKIWPEAKLYGVNSAPPMHDVDGRIKFDYFIGEDGEGMREQEREAVASMLNEFKVYRLQGHQFKETLLYHKPTKTLHGLTDMVAAGTKSRFPNFFSSLYFFSLGMSRRGGNLDEKLNTQAYFYIFTTDATKLAHSIVDVLDEDWEVASLGHGGRLEGQQGKHEIEHAFRWLFKRDAGGNVNVIYNINAFEKVVLPILFLQRYDLLSTVVGLAGAALKHSVRPVVESGAH